MPLDTNIALGVRPVEQPNMLAQMGQMMQIRQAQQGFDDKNALRDIAARHGGNISSPAFLEELGSFDPKYAAELKTTALANAKTTSEIAEKTFLGSLNALHEVKTPEDLLKFKLSRLSDPYMGPILKARGVTPEMVTAGVQSEISSLGFDASLKKTSMSLTDFYKDQTSRRNSDVTSGPGYLQADIAQKRLDYDIKNPSQHFFTGEDGTLMTAPQRGGGGASPVPMAGSGAPPPQIPMGGGGSGSSIMVNGTPVNNLAPTANAPANNLAPTANVPTFATVRGTAPTYQSIVDPTNPKQMITIDPKVYRGGGVSSDNVRAPGVVGVAGKEPTAALREQKTVGAENALTAELDNLRFAYRQLNEAKAIPSTARSGASNLAASTQTSGAGQFAGKVFGTTEQSLRDNIKSSNLRLLQAVKSATGMSAQELNSNMELKTWIDSLTDPSKSYESNIKNIDLIENFVKKRANRGDATPRAGTSSGSPSLPPGFKLD